MDGSVPAAGVRGGVRGGADVDMSNVPAWHSETQAWQAMDSHHAEEPAMPEEELPDYTDIINMLANQPPMPPPAAASSSTEADPSHIWDPDTSTWRQRFPRRERAREQIHKGASKDWIQRRPDRIFLIRHGESWGNVDETIYERVPDNRVELTTLGQEQAADVGRKLASIIGSERARFFVSPYTRTMQTYHAITHYLAGPYDGAQFSYVEEPRLREQDWGNLQNNKAIQQCRSERQRFGSFYYRFPQGESGADVYDRVTSFIETLHREMDKTHNENNFVLLSHGITIRLFLMRYFKWTVDYFHQLHNPSNCQIMMLKKLPNGKYQLSPTVFDDAPDAHRKSTGGIWNPLIRPPQDKDR